MEKYIFLDFNGTILDDLDLCFNLLNEMLYEKERITVDLKRYKEIFDFPIINYYVKAGFDFSKYTFEELANYFIIEYRNRTLTETKIFEDVPYFVKSLKAAGYKIVICSASQKLMLLDQLKYFGIDELFDDVIALDNHYAASKLELAKLYVEKHKIHLEQSYFIGDTTHDAEVGEECGLNVILVERGHQSKDVLLKANSLILGTLKETAEFIKKTESF